MRASGRWARVSSSNWCGKALAESFGRSNRAGDGRVAYPGEYLVTLGEKREEG